LGTTGCGSQHFDLDREPQVVVPNLLIVVWGLPTQNPGLKLLIVKRWDKKPSVFKHA